MEEMQNKIANLTKTFNNDEKAKGLIEELKARFNELLNAEFTADDFGTDEFSEASEDYFTMCRDGEPDEMTIFDILWFKA